MPFIQIPLPVLSLTENWSVPLQRSVREVDANAPEQRHQKDAGKPARNMCRKSKRGRSTLAYIRRHWDGLQTFLNDRRVEIHSNSVENLIRPIALNRKNALFAGHGEGGRAWGRIASLIETAKINGVSPFSYLKAIAAGHP